MPHFQFELNKNHEGLKRVLKYSNSSFVLLWIQELTIKITINFMINIVSIGRANPFLMIFV